MNEVMKKLGTTALKRALLLGVIGAILMSFMGVQTLTSTNTTATITLANETVTADADTAVTYKGLSKVASNAAAAGTTAPGVEGTTALAAVQTALTKNNYAYSFEFKEAAITSWPATRQYKIEVYGDNGTTVSLLATLYTQNATADATAIEGVTVKIDTGSASTTYDSYSAIVTKVQ